MSRDRAEAKFDLAYLRCYTSQPTETVDGVAEYLLFFGKRREPGAGIRIGRHWSLSVTSDLLPVTVADSSPTRSSMISPSFS